MLQYSELLTDGLEVCLRGVTELLEGDPPGLCLVGQVMKVLVHASLLALAHLLARPLEYSLPKQYAPCQQLSKHLHIGGSIARMIIDPHLRSPI